MASEVLSKVTLQFGDNDLHTIYKREKTDFYSKSLPIVTFMLGMLAASLEVVYRISDLGTLPNYISLVNWVCFGLLALICVLHSRITVLHLIICPMLTLITFLYMSFVDYDYTIGSIYYT